MLTFDRLSPWVLGAIALLTASVDCGGPSGDCLRYSDCAAGLTCAAGKCVAPPLPAPDDGGSTNDDGNVEGASALADAASVGAQSSTGDGGDDAPAE